VVISLDDEKITYMIVGSQESNIFENKISNESPLGRALIGKNVGETIKVMSPGGEKTYSVINVV
jgi:transcription elongation factor GreA